MSHFFPNGDNSDPGLHDEEYTANLWVTTAIRGKAAFVNNSIRYGGLVVYGTNNTKYMPKARDITKSNDAMLWYDEIESSFEFKFSDSPAKPNEKQYVNSCSKSILDLS